MGLKVLPKWLVRFLVKTGLLHLLNRCHHKSYNMSLMDACTKMTKDPELLEIFVQIFDVGMTDPWSVWAPGLNYLTK